MIPAARNTRLRAAAAVIAVAAVVLALVGACAGQPQQHAAQHAARTAKREVPAHRVSPTPAPPRIVAVGTLGTYRVGQRYMTFSEPAHIAPDGRNVGQRTMMTVVQYPLAQGSAGSQPAAGRFPLLVFAPGYMLCDGPYWGLLQAWASAGYVVAAVDFPRTNCHTGAPDESDLVNQPADLSYALSRLLAVSARSGDLFSGLLNRNEIGTAGHSDGGDTVAALAANACCTDHRLQAVAVFSGAEWQMPGRYFSHGAPPMLFVQGSADTINPPWASLHLYQADRANARYYLDLFGVSHWTPYQGTAPVEKLVARVTLAFFNRYLLGRASALATMTRDGNVSGTAALFSGGQLPP